MHKGFLLRMTAKSAKVSAKASSKCLPACRPFATQHLGQKQNIWNVFRICNFNMTFNEEKKNVKEDKTACTFAQFCMVTEWAHEKLKLIPLWKHCIPGNLPARRACESSCPTESLRKSCIFHLAICWHCHKKKNKKNNILSSAMENSFVV